MQNNKFELVKTDTKQWCGRTSYRIRALVEIGALVAAGDLGGYIESEAIIDVSGNAWVSGNAQVYGDARVSGNAWVYGDAQVYGNAQIVWFSKVGSECGTLTVCRAKEGLFVSRGCFSGNDVEFLTAVDEYHGKESKVGKEYHLLIEVARSRLIE